MNSRPATVFVGWAFFCLASLIGVSAAIGQTAHQRATEAASVTIPLRSGGLFGSVTNMYAEVFKPIGEGPFPVMVYAHGRSGTQQERSALREVIPRQYLEFWISRGFAAVGVARPGYGPTGGGDREYAGHTWEGPGRCGGNFEPRKVAEAAGSAILAAVDWTRRQNWAKRDALIVTGNSVGGMTAAFVGAKSPEGVAGYINFAGGVGGNPGFSPRRSCFPERMENFFAGLGIATQISNLWLYAENDLFWGSEAARSWHSAFAASTKSPTIFTMIQPIAAPDGHDLIFVGKDDWEPHVVNFLNRLGF